jgi:hypothetical protein
VAEVPSDLRVHAFFYPGGGPGRWEDTSPAAMARWPKPWTLMLDARGNAKREVDLSVVRGDVLDSQPTYQTINVQPRELAALVTAIKQADFFSLPGFVSREPIEHTGGAVLAITLNGRMHKVTLYSTAMTQNALATKRLRQIWRALFRLVPSPNQNRELSWFSGGRHTIQAGDGANR